MTLAQEILSNTSDQTIPISTLLRKFKVFLSAINDQEKLRWVDKELRGYKGDKEELPDYRISAAHTLGHFNGPAGSGLRNARVPLMHLPENIREDFSQTLIYEGAEEIENLIASDGDNLRKPWPAELIAACQWEFYQGLVAAEIWQVVPKSDLIRITSAIRDEIADYIISMQSRRPEIMKSESALQTEDSQSLVRRSVRGRVVKPERQLRVFLSYSHADEQYKIELDKHLSVLRRTGYVSTWNDRLIPAGADWELEIDENIRSADIVLLLISADFINSDYCYGKEMDIALTRHDAGEAIVIPIIARHAYLEGTPFMSLQAFPKDARPITSFADKDEAYAQITRAIQGVAVNFEDTLKKRRD